MIATTIEQGKRLLDAGVKPETADMMWILKRLIISASGKSYEWQLNTVQITPCETQPAWSLSALWGLANEKGLVLEFNTKEDMADGIVDILVDCLTDPIVKLMDDLKDGKI